MFPIDLMWDLPQLAEFMDALGRVARVIMYDSRGSGASDRDADDRRRRGARRCDG